MNLPVKGAEMSLIRCFEIAVTRPVVKRATITSAIVGTLLGALNHGHKFMPMTLETADIWRIMLTYLVPFSVATVSAVLTVRHAEKIAEAGLAEPVMPLVPAAGRPVGPAPEQTRDNLKKLIAASDPNQKSA